LDRLAAADELFLAADSTEGGNRSSGDGSWLRWKRPAESIRKAAVGCVSAGGAIRGGGRPGPGGWSGTWCGVMEMTVTVSSTASGGDGGPLVAPLAASAE